MTKWNKSLKEMECTHLWTLKLDWSMLKVLVRIILTSGENQSHENHNHQNLVSYVQQINILCIASSIEKGVDMCQVLRDCVCDYILATE